MDGYDISSNTKIMQDKKGRRRIPSIQLHDLYLRLKVQETRLDHQIYATIIESMKHELTESAIIEIIAHPERITCRLIDPHEQALRKKEMIQRYRQRISLLKMEIVAILNSYFAYLKYKNKGQKPPQKYAWLQEIKDQQILLLFEGKFKSLAAQLSKPYELKTMEQFLSQFKQFYTKAYLPYIYQNKVISQLQDDIQYQRFYLDMQDQFQQCLDQQKQ